VKADEIFVLLLIVVSVGVVLAVAIQSRRQKEAPDPEHSQAGEETVTSQLPNLDEEAADPVKRGKKRRP
jgi:hypothetical protein